VIGPPEYGTRLGEKSSLRPGLVWKIFTTEDTGEQGHGGTEEHGDFLQSTAISLCFSVFSVVKG
jgi:hypothetical protein